MFIYLKLNWDKPFSKIIKLPLENVYCILLISGYSLSFFIKVLFQNYYKTSSYYYMPTAILGGVAISITISIILKKNEMDNRMKAWNLLYLQMTILASHLIGNFLNPEKLIQLGYTTIFFLISEICLIVLLRARFLFYKAVTRETKVINNLKTLLLTYMYLYNLIKKNNF